MIHYSKNGAHIVPAVREPVGVRALSRAGGSDGVGTQLAAGPGPAVDDAGLWDEVTPDLRGFAVTIGVGRVGARFLYDRAVDEDMEEIVSEVETYVLADFPASLRTSFRAVHVPVGHPRDLLAGEEWVYLRKER